MKSKFTSVVLSAGLALSLAGCAASAGDPSAPEAKDTKPTADQEHQQRIASTTLALENAFDVQFVKGHIDSDALQPLINDVLQAFPDDSRPQVEKHIYDVIAKGQKDASEMTPEQRAELASPASADKQDKQQVDIIGAWGWGYPAGYAAAGGCGGGVAVASTGCGGAVGWGGGWGPGVAATGWGGCAGCGWGGGWGWGAPAAVGWGGGWGWPGYGVGYAGLGGWGWGWGGYGAFGFPACGLGWGGGWGWGGAGLGWGGGWGW